MRNTVSMSCLKKKEVRMEDKLNIFGRIGLGNRKASGKIHYISDKFHSEDYFSIFFFQ